MKRMLIVCTVPNSSNETVVEAVVVERVVEGVVEGVVVETVVEVVAVETVVVVEGKIFF